MKEKVYYYLVTAWDYKENMTAGEASGNKYWFRPLQDMDIYPTMEHLNRDFHNWTIRKHCDNPYIGEIVIKPGKHVELVTHYKDYVEKENK